MKFIKNPTICSRCTQLVARDGSLRSSVVTDNKIIIRNLYCLDCQRQMLIGKTVKAHDAVGQLWPGKVAA